MILNLLLVYTVTTTIALAGALYLRRNGCVIIRPVDIMLCFIPILHLLFALVAVQEFCCVARAAAIKLLSIRINLRGGK